MAGEKVEYLHAKLSDGSRTAYGSGWRHWLLFCKARGRDPWLLGRSEREAREDEEILLEFMVHLARWFRRTAGTIQNKIMG